MVKNKSFIVLLILGFLAIVLVSGVDVVFSQKAEKRSPAMVKPVSLEAQKNLGRVFENIAAPSIGDQAQRLLEPKTQEKLSKYADLIVSKVAFRDEKNPLYIDDPDMHRMLCFFVTGYVYAAEAQGLPPQAQIYLVFENESNREEKLEVEINKVQSVFNRCRDLELQIQSTGLVYFKWDVTNYLNGIPIEKEKSKLSEIPEEFRDDPLLAKMYESEAKGEERFAEQHQFEDEMTMIFLQGVHRQLSAGEADPLKLVQQFVKQAGRKVAQDAWEDRAEVYQSLTRDEKNIFAANALEKNTAKQLTNLVAVPNMTTVSNTAFQKAIRSIVESDIKFKYKVGKDLIYAGFTLNFE